MTLPLTPPIKPQLALTRKELPLGEEWAYEQKLDGFRAIVFVDGEDVYIQSRGGKSLGRYFPELSFPTGRYVLDGELVIRDADGGLEFDALQSRIHPAESRITLLSKEIPANFVAFDLLAEGDEVAARDAAAASGAPGSTRSPGKRSSRSASSAPIPPTPRSGCGRTEGTMAKELDAPYEPGKRKGWRRSSASARSTAW